MIALYLVLDVGGEILAEVAWGKIYQHVKYVKTRSLGARWAPTSRPAARTPGPTGPPDPGPPTQDPGPPTPEPGRLWALRACLISLDNVLAVG